MSGKDYEKALYIAQRFSINLNDAIAYVKMVKKNASEVYTFDRHFANLPSAIVLPRAGIIRQSAPTYKPPSSSKGHFRRFCLSPSRKPLVSMSEKEMRTKNDTHYASRMKRAKRC